MLGSCDTRLTVPMVKSSKRVRRSSDAGEPGEPDVDLPDTDVSLRPIPRPSDRPESAGSTQTRRFFAHTFPPTKARRSTRIIELTHVHFWLATWPRCAPTAQRDYDAEVGTLTLHFLVALSSLSLPNSLFSPPHPPPSRTTSRTTTCLRIITRAPPARARQAVRLPASSSR